LTPIRITDENSDRYFYLERFIHGVQTGAFDCSITEYNVYLSEDALRSQNDHIALTWLLRDNSNKETVAYMALIADAIKLSVQEKVFHSLGYPFRTVPAMKIAKLAVASLYQERYTGIGSFLISTALSFARQCNERYFACRFLTVDADIEHNKSVLRFYEKNGFLINSELFNPKRKTISMRKDIYL
jgi:ribosomal protein S18 acetylase RimI-like enzyme